MFYYVNGTVAETGPNLAVIDCGGVGYACATTNYTLSQLKKGERAKLYEQAQVIFKDQAPWNTIAHSVVNEPISTKVQGYKIDPFGGHVFYGVSLTE